MDNFDEFDLADNDVETPTEEVASPQPEGAEKPSEVQTEEVKEPSPQPQEQTETQRVSQRIKEAKQQARDEMVAEKRQTWNGKLITTEAEERQAYEEYNQQQEKQKLLDDGVSELVADKMLKADKYINKAEQQEQAQEQEQKAIQEAEAKRQADFNEFINDFPGVDANKIDKSVWEDVAHGKSLVQAYTKFENNQLKEKLKVLEQNQSNKNKAPLKNGVASHGSNEVASEDDFLNGFDSL